MITILKLSCCFGPFAEKCEAAGVDAIVAEGLKQVVTTAGKKPQLYP